jgi:acid phosphatase
MRIHSSLLTLSKALNTFSLNAFYCPKILGRRTMNIRNLILTFAAITSEAAISQADGAPAVNEFNHIVVIYQENHSFDNLFGLWGEVNSRPVDGLDNADPTHTSQIRVDNKTRYKCLLQNDVNLTSPPLPVTCMDETGAKFESAFPNKPFMIDEYISPADMTCPDPAGGRSPPEGVKKGTGHAGGCTRDLVHSFYDEQYQINNGKQNRYVTGSNATGLVMGYYDTTKLPIYIYLHSPGAPNYAIADSFFHAAFGGSFLNHLWLIAATTPEFADAADDGSANDYHTIVDENGMPADTRAPLYKNQSGIARTDRSKPLLTVSCNFPHPAKVKCGDYAINTVQPFYQPYKPGTPDAQRLPPLTNPTIGDRLTEAGVDWAWYSGGWSNANGDTEAPGWTNGAGPGCTDPNANPKAAFPHCPDELFEYHHQPFNYYKNYAPGTPGRDHLLDEKAFKRAARSGILKQVSFVKPIGADNEHPGYASETTGDTHLVDLISMIVNCPNGEDTLIIVTYDEFGGWWDHVPPPQFRPGGEGSAHDEWGPGTRVPALLIAKKFRQSAVDHTDHDTTSILKLIEERFHLEPLGSRDKNVESLNTALEAAGVNE